MAKRLHSVSLDKDKCKGCTNCIKWCPTEAIRVRDGIAQINAERCIDCGECIRRCPNHAKIAVTDGLDAINKYEYAVALPAPALYGQFSIDTGINKVLHGLKNLGFNEVVEVARGADYSTEAIKKYIADFKDAPKPLISSACPAVVRLIQVKFHNLIKNLIPIKTPLDIAAEMAKKDACERLGIKPENVGVFFITPCAAKAIYIKLPIGISNSAVDGSISISEVFGKLRKEVSGINDASLKQIASGYGIGWARAGGENVAVGDINHLAVDGIHDVMGVLEEIELGRLNDVDYVETAACVGGCVGGPLTVENSYLSRVRIRKLAKGLSKDNSFTNSEKIEIGKKYQHGEYNFDSKIIPVKSDILDDDLSKAIEKANLLEETLESLPGLDCGACGAPTCQALAEDIVTGLASDTDCTFKLREEVRSLAEKLFDLAKIVPPAMGTKKDKKKNKDTQNNKDEKEMQDKLDI